MVGRREDDPVNVLAIEHVAVASVSGHIVALADPARNHSTTDTAVSTISLSRLCAARRRYVSISVLSRGSGSWSLVKQRELVRGTFFAKVSPHTPLQNFCALARLLAPLGLRANAGPTLSFPPLPLGRKGQVGKSSEGGIGGEPFGREGFPPCSFTFQGPEPTNPGKIEMHPEATRGGFVPYRRSQN